MYWAHRGSHGVAGVLENTLPAFERALSVGADGVELDVHLSRDGVPVVFHDLTLDRLTGGDDPRPIADLDVAMIQRVRLLGDARIPTLTEALDLLLPTLPVNVEIKDATAVPAVLRALANSPDGAEVVISSLDPEAVAAVASASPRLPRALITRAEVVHADGRVRAVHPLRAIRRSRATRWHPDHRLLTPSLMTTLGCAGIEIHAWTVHDPSVVARLRAWGVAGVFTDRPEALRAGWSATTSAR